MSRLILGCCATGAKYTKKNHKKTGNEEIDCICSGEKIPKTLDEAANEAVALHALGVRYFHYHARDGASGEQSTRNEIYSALGLCLQKRTPEMILSYGASRNGRQVLDEIKKDGEWARASQSALSIERGGAHFVTLQAAVELQVICDFERWAGALSWEYLNSPRYAEDINLYAPSVEVDELALEVHSTAGGASYGSSSAAVQLDVYRRSLQARRDLKLLHEVEWVQLLRSCAMTRLAIEHPELRLASSKQLNVTILFGFSPKLPFPQTYREFRKAVTAAKALEYDIGSKIKTRHVSITVGAAIIPQYATREIQPIDVGRQKGRKLSALHRLAVYASQADSEVDVLRFGMEDTPYELADNGALRPTTNIAIARGVLHTLAKENAEVVTDKEEIWCRFGCSEPSAHRAAATYDAA